jgi:hydrogenase maturation protein HypF
MPLIEEDGFLVLDAPETIRAVAADLDAGAAAGSVASRFHAALAAATVSACSRIAHGSGTDLVVLAGGVFQNRRLVEAVTAGLEAGGLRVLLPERLPPGDGAISYGQAAVAACRLARSAG